MNVGLSLPRCRRRCATRSPRLRGPGQWPDRCCPCSCAASLIPSTDLGLGRNDLIFGLEPFLDIDAELALGQIDHMAHRRRDLEIASQVALDRLGLGWRLDDYRGSLPLLLPRFPLATGLKLSMPSEKQLTWMLRTTFPRNSSSRSNLSTVADIQSRALDNEST